MGIEMMMVWYILESLLTFLFILKLIKWNSIKILIYENLFRNKCLSYKCEEDFLKKTLDSEHPNFLCHGVHFLIFP